MRLAINRAYTLTTALLARLVSARALQQILAVHLIDFPCAISRRHRKMTHAERRGYLNFMANVVLAESTSTPLESQGKVYHEHVLDVMKGATQRRSA